MSFSWRFAPFQHVWTNIVANSFFRIYNDGRQDFEIFFSLYRFRSRTKLDRPYLLTYYANPFSMCQCRTILTQRWTYSNNTQTYTGIYRHFAPWSGP